MFLNQTQATQRFLSTLTQFDMRLTPEGTENPNFDRLLEWVGVYVIAKIIEFSFQLLFMGQNRSSNG